MRPGGSLALLDFQLQFLQSWAGGSQEQRNALTETINTVLPLLQHFCGEEGTCPGSVPGPLLPLLRQQ
jgi:hypothetical protein